jgi:hypothetical protein
MAHPTAYESNAPDVVFEAYPDETVLIHFPTGCYYSLDVVGQQLWEALSQGVAVGDVVEWARSYYAGDSEKIGEVVVGFANALAEEKLLRPVEAPLPPEGGSLLPAVAAKGERPLFVPPLLSRFRDMQEMLLFDPVHEVTEAGWPRVEAPQLQPDEFGRWPRPDDDA